MASPGCVGGSATGSGSSCKPGLTGVYCLLCEADDTYHDASTSTCEPCTEATRRWPPARQTFAIVVGTLLVGSCLGALLLRSLNARTRHAAGRRDAASRAALARLVWLRQRLHRLKALAKPKFKLLAC